MTEHRGTYRITDDADADAVDLDVVHGFLETSYWSSGIPRETVARGIRHSLCFSVFDGPRQVGFARVVTDHATVAYLADVFVVPGHRGRGLGRWIVETVAGHPDLQGLRRWLLATRDAHGLYRKFGFEDVPGSSTLMTRHDPDVYRRRSLE